MAIEMDGIIYRVRVKSDPMLEERFVIADGDAAGTMLSGREVRDVIGTYYSHTLSVEPDPAWPEDYDAFYQAVSAPVDSHTLTLPHGAGTITYQAMVTEGVHRLRGRMNGRNHFMGLEVAFTPLTPQRTPH